MGVTSEISVEAIDQKLGLTLGELKQLIAACDGADDTTEIKVRVNFKSGIRKITAFVR